MIDPREVYEAWAPRDAFWARWTKPLLFAKLQPGDLVGPGPVADQDARWAALARDVAIIVDVPGERAVAIGIALVERGYRPIPLFNGVPAIGALVATADIVRDLVAGAVVLRRQALSPDAAPAFLLDSRRNGGGAIVQPGAFDNRWCVLLQDLPSAALLRSRGITKVVLYTERRAGLSIASTVADDLAHVLRRYQEAGLAMSVVYEGSESATPLEVAEPPYFRSLWYRLQVLAGLRRNSAGGFGDVVPTPSSGGGFS